jgi:uncharacterized protein (TIGR02147 family)
MSNVSVFEFDDYKAFLRAQAKGQRGRVSRLAAAAGCQRSYLSRVLSSEAHLTPDHAHAMADFLGLEGGESEYFLLLVERARAGTASYRKHLKSKLETLSQRRLEISNRVRRPPPEDGPMERLYYSSWHWSAIHIAVSIPGLQTEDALAQELGLPGDLVRTSLLKLAEMNLVRRERDRWMHHSSDIHLERKSPMIAMHHGNWRQRAVLDSQRSESDGVHYTAMQSMSESAFREIRREMLELIERSVRTAGPSRSERLVCLCMDLF